MPLTGRRSLPSQVSPSPNYAVFPAANRGLAPRRVRVNSHIPERNGRPCLWECVGLEPDTLRAAFPETLESAGYRWHLEFSFDHSARAGAGVASALAACAAGASPCGLRAAGPIAFVAAGWSASRPGMTAPRRARRRPNGSGLPRSSTPASARSAAPSRESAARQVRRSRHRGLGLDGSAGCSSTRALKPSGALPPSKRRPVAAAADARDHVGQTGAAASGRAGGFNIFAAETSQDAPYFADNTVQGQQGRGWGWWRGWSTSASKIHEIKGCWAIEGISSRPICFCAERRHRGGARDAGRGFAWWPTTARPVGAHQRKFKKSRAHVARRRSVRQTERAIGEMASQDMDFASKSSSTSEMMREVQEVNGAMADAVGSWRRSLRRSARASTPPSLTSSSRTR